MSGIDPDLRRARTLPSDWYTDPARYAQSLESVFAASWQWLDEVRDLPSSHARAATLLPGSLDEELLVARSATGALSVFSNVCTHRGHLLLDPGSCAERLRCRYHGRRFHLDGRFHSAPGFEGAQDFPAPTDDLPAVAFGTLGAHVLCALRPPTELDSALAPLVDRVGRDGFAQMREDQSRRRLFRVEAHWALYVENYLEGFHIPYVHPGLARAVDVSTYEVHEFEHGTLQVAEAKPGETALELPAHSPDRGRRIAAYYFWLFPNSMWNVYPWGLSLNVVQPLGPGRCRVLFRAFVHRPELLGQGASQDLDQVEREDEEVVERVQRGIRSRLYHSGRYSPRHESGVHLFHRLLERTGCTGAAGGA